MAQLINLLVEFAVHFNKVILIIMVQHIPLAADYLFQLFQIRSRRILHCIFDCQHLQRFSDF